MCPLQAHAWPFLKAPRMQISMHDKPRCMLRMHVSPTMLYFRDVNDGVRSTRTHARTYARHVSVTLAISTARGNTYRLRVNLPRAWARLAEKCRFVICNIILLNRTKPASQCSANIPQIYILMHRES